MSSGAKLQIDSASTSVLKIDGTATASTAITDATGTANTFNSSNQTLEIGTAGSLTINVAQTVTNGTIQLDGGTLIDTNSAGLTIGGGATLIGNGVIGNSTNSTPVGGTGNIIASGGILEFKGAVDASALSSFEIANLPNSELKFDSALGTSSIHPTITFDGANSGQGKLDLTGEGTGASVTVSNFAIGDQILTRGASSTDSLSYNSTTGVLSVMNGASVLETIKLTTSYQSNQFQISHSGFGSTRVDTITTTAICFYPGTMVRTPAGEVAVETLRRGDLVVTSDGLAKPVRWLGRQTISTVFSDPLRVWPIRIRAGALGENVPARDLRLSPDHAVLVDGALIQAGALVNGTSIVHETAVPKVFIYYHVELDDHSLILAENTPAETFIDNVERLAFDNWAEHEALYPDGKQIEELPYARAKARRQVPVAVRVKLAERAELIGVVEKVSAA